MPANLKSVWILTRNGRSNPNIAGREDGKKERNIKKRETIKYEKPDQIV